MIFHRKMTFPLNPVKLKIPNKLQSHPFIIKLWFTVIVDRPRSMHKSIFKTSMICLNFRLILILIPLSQFSPTMEIPSLPFSIIIDRFRLTFRIDNEQRPISFRNEILSAFLPNLLCLSLVLVTILLSLYFKHVS